MGGRGDRKGGLGVFNDGDWGRGGYGAMGIGERGWGYGDWGRNWGMRPWGLGKGDSVYNHEERGRIETQGNGGIEAFEN